MKEHPLKPCGAHTPVEKNAPVQKEPSILAHGLQLTCCTVTLHKRCMQNMPILMTCLTYKCRNKTMCVCVLRSVCVCLSFLDMETILQSIPWLPVPGDPEVSMDNNKSTWAWGLCHSDAPGSLSMQDGLHL